MHDDFSARYRLLKCVLVEDGIRTHNAQERDSGRVVMVHISDAAGPEEVESLRTQLTALSLADRNRVLEAVTLPYGFAVVTEFLPTPLTFRGWLAAGATSEPTPTSGMGHSATIRIPDPSQLAAAEPERPLAPPVDHTLDLRIETPPTASAPRADSFTAMFGAAAPPAPVLDTFAPPTTSRLSIDVTSVAESLPESASPVPDAVTPEAMAPAASPVSISSPVTPAAAAPSPPAATPGAFTRMFAPGIDAHTPPPTAPLASAPPVGAVPASAPSAPSAPAHPAPGEFTKLFGAPETAAPLPETMRPSPMRDAPPPTFSPLTPERQLESPPVEPRHRVVTSQPNYLSGIQQDGRSPIAPSVSSGGYAGLPPLMPLAPAAPVPPAHVSPMYAAAGPTPPTAPALTPGILPPPIFSSGTQTPLSALGGAAPLVNASAGPSEFTRLISSAAEPVIPPLEPTAALTPGRAAASGRRPLPNGLIFVINAVLLIAALLMWFVLRRPIPTAQQIVPTRVYIPPVPTAPQLPTTPSR